MKNNVIDLGAIREAKNLVSDNSSEKVKSIKMRVELHKTRMMVSTSLLSILFLVTAANSAFLTSNGSAVIAAKVGERGIASVQTGTSNWEDRIAEKLALRSLKPETQAGRRGSVLDQLTFGTLEGNYAVRMQNGKINEIQFSKDETNKLPKRIVDLSSFLKESRSLIATPFEKVEISESSQEGAYTHKSFRLIGENHQDLGSVDFSLDANGRLLAMKISGSNVAVK